MYPALQKGLQRIRFDGKDPNGNNILANGIERCAFNPRDGKFYLNIPVTGLPTAMPPGPVVVLRISADAPFHMEHSAITAFERASFVGASTTASLTRRIA